MPEVVAEFISAQFYGRKLNSKVKRPLRDDLFAAAMALIDTGELKAGDRRERRPRADEHWPKDSFVNDAEAVLIADLAAYYHARNDDWVVIVPFSAQKGKVTTLLTDLLGNEELVASRVASVDSFQGGERNIVIFGFTRSNAKGEIGFLKDVRRINVAFSRAKYQLIIVGDLDMLCRVRYPGFAAMAEALRDHVRGQGDLRSYREVRTLLAGETYR
jgi:superfamily I DNA and/or RNA helicase